MPRSSRKDEGVLVPVNMAQPLQDALSRIEDAVGDIDAYVTRELGYKDTAAMHDALMGLQVDSVASAIYQNKVRGKGVIIADQTGIGKGRQAAAMIRWAIKQGMTPVFLTVKPSLFTDMYGDLRDIGSTDVKPLLLNKDEWITGADGKPLFKNKPGQHSKKLSEIADSGKLPDGSNALFMTYSQINKENVQRRALAALAPNAFFVMDESHNAGGDSQTGEFIRGVLGEVRGAVYLSATYAKRPDNMPVYFRTDIGDAIEGGSEALIEAMKQGGLPLQTVVANGLVQSGQMFRRERSYDGVSIETKVDSANRAKHSALSDRVTLALRAIVEADGEFHNGYVVEQQMQAAARGEAIGGGGNQASEGVSHTEFSSVVHNFVKQLLLGLKADTAADAAIAEIKAGRKPLIALENTMGSFLTQYASDHALGEGDTLADFDYRTVLSRALERTRAIVRTNAMGEKIREEIPLAKLDANTRRVYLAAQEVIDSLDGLSDLPVSPIDWIRHRIQQAGYSVAEVTGRDLAVDYSGPTPVLTRVPSEEQNDKVATTNRFNQIKGRGTKKDALDAIILNVSGSTGISLHASERFGDKRPRHMIVAQPASDINIFMQMLGRIHRTGQVELPSYSILNVDLPAEKRPTAVLNRKMKSLNANTSSNSESATSIKAADFLNKYGDQIVNQYLYDAPKLARELGITPKDPAGESSVEEDIARKATGRLALMPVAVQEAFYADVEQQYNDLIDYLDKTGQNDLEPRTLDFDAELVEEHVLVDETNPESPFGREAVYGEYKIKAQGKPMTVAEIREQIDEHLGAHLTADDTRTGSYARAGMRHAEALVAELDGKMPPRDPNLPPGQMTPEESVAGQGRGFIRQHPIGSLWRVEINGDVYNAVVTNLRNTHKGGGNPFSMSKTQVTLALNGPLRQIMVPASQWAKIEVSAIGGYGVSLEGAFRVASEGSQLAKIVTGNLLGAYGELRGTSSQIITFSKKDGTIEQGILLPKKFDLEKNTYGDFQLRTPAALLQFLSASTNPDTDRFGVASRDQNIRVQMDNAGGLILSTPKSKARGGKYFLNKKLLAVTGDFVSSGDSMRATVPKDKAAAALDALMSNTAIYALPSMAEEARAILARGAQSRPEPAARQGWVDTGVLDTAVQRVVGQWRGDIPTVRVVTLAEELPAEAKSGRGWETAEGWYDGYGTVYLVANNIPNVNRGLQVLAHEAIGHYGVEAVMGKAQWTQVVGDVAKLRRRADSLPADMKAAMASAVRRYGNENASTFAREFLAILAERGVKSSLTARVMAAVRRWLRSMGFAMESWSAAELRQIVADGAKQVTRRRSARQSSDRRGAALSERASPFFSAMVEAVERAQGAPKQADARAWKGWLDGAQRRGEFKQAERDWLGVDAWLDQQTGPVSRDAIAGYVRDHQVRIEEVALGDPEDTNETAEELENTLREIVARQRGQVTEEHEYAIAEYMAGDLGDGDLARELGISLQDVVEAGRTAESRAFGAVAYENYQLPGGDNYRELLLTLPPAKVAPAAIDTTGWTVMDRTDPDGAARFTGQRELDVLGRDGRVVSRMTAFAGTDAEAIARAAASRQQSGLREARDTAEYRSSHWDHPNVLAHVRYNERVDADGKRVLFIEEIQSDWHQEGRKKGYGQQRSFVVETPRGEILATRPTREAAEALAAESGPGHKVREGASRPGVPDAPMKGTDEWAMLAFKRMVRVAAEGGFDRIAWPPGQVHADRYDLSTQVTAVEARPLGDDSFEVTIVDRRGNEGMAGNKSWRADELPNLVGKELADKIIADTAGGWSKRYSGLDLKVGGAGMIGFYDKILPAAVNKWAKKLGGRVGEAQIQSYDPPTGRKHLFARTDVHSLDLTDAMREVALAGMPLFSRPEPEFVIYDTRGKELGREATLLEANRAASRMRNAGKRVRSVERAAPAPAFADSTPPVTATVNRFDDDAGRAFRELPAVRRALDAAVARGSVAPVLDTIAGLDDTGVAGGAELARTLAPLMDRLQVKLVAPPKELPYAGAYTLSKNTVWARQALPEVVLHEALHAATSAAISSSKLQQASPQVRLAVAQLELIRQKLGAADLTDAPADVRTLLRSKTGPLANAKELLAYGMTNQPLQRWLATQPAPTKAMPRRTLWDRFKDTVARLVGASGEARTALDSIMDAGTSLLDFAASNPDAIRVVRFTEGARRGGVDPSMATVMDAADRITSRPRHAVPARFDAEQAAAAEKFVTFQRREPLTARVAQIKDKAGARLVQKVFDQFRPLRDLDSTAFMQAHMAKATDGALEAAFEHGIPVLRGGAFDIAERTGGFKKVMAELAGEHDQFLMWVVGSRAESLRMEGREHLFTKDDIAAMKRLNQGAMADGSSRPAAYAAALRELQRYNKAFLDIAEQAGVINKEGRKVWESEFYVPFYREMDRDPRNGPGQIKGLLRQRVIERLVGGKEPLGDPLESILANWSHMLTASMKNMAATKALAAGVKAGIAEKVDGPQKGAVWAMVDGIEDYYFVHDPMVLEALESLSFNGFDNPLMRAAGKFKRVLTTTVTINPSFRIRNLARDVLSAMATSDVGYNPVANMVTGMKVLSNDAAGVSMLAGGGRIRFGSINDGAQAQHAKRLIESGIDDRHVLDSRDKMAGALRRAYDWWQEVGDKAETVNRAVIYDRAIKAGKSHLEASYEARDLMNFTSMGSAAIIRALSQVLPFFNARLQGMDRLGRGAARNPARFAAVTGTLALASAALYLLQADDDDYKALPDYVRDTYWPVKIGGQFYYIPKPFEVGAMATIVERATELAVAGDDYRAKDFGANILNIAMSQLAMNPIPQIVRPVTEAAFNYDLFRKAPIDSMGQQNLLPEDRYTARTRAGAVALGKLTGLSPQRLEHMVRGYFGWVGIQALNVSDYLLRDVIGMPSGAHQDLTRPSNLFVVGDFVKDPEAISSKYLTRFYDQQNKIDRIYASVNMARRTGDSERAAALAASPQLANRPLYQHADTQITKINRTIRTITAHPTMTAAEKNARIDALNRQRNAIAMRVDAAARGRE